MEVTNEVLPYFLWLIWNEQHVGFLISAAVILGLLAFLGFNFGLMVSAIRHGPNEGLNVVARNMFDAVQFDLPQFSLRRMLAIAWLAVQEAIRRWVLVAFVVFVILLLFAGMFLDVKNENPARIYLSFVLFSSTILILLLGLFLSTFSLPADIKNRTIYTIVTKPVRSGEIVAGRILGFSAVGSVILLLMALVSYIFVVRGLAHTHELKAEDFVDIPAKQAGGKSPGQRAETSFNQHHRHKVTQTDKGNFTVEQQKGHWHDVTKVGEGKDAKYILSNAQGDLEARVPIFGKLTYRDRQGNITNRGINTGDEWEYRSAIEGGTASEAVWKFRDIRPERFPEGLPLELTIQVFRTYKGNIERGILGEIIVRNPGADARVRSSGPIPFESREYITDSRFIPRKLKPLTSVSGETEIDLFDDLVSKDGELEIVLRCVEGGQYFSVAQADLYIRATDHSFFFNFLKGYLGIWLQMLLIITFGVMFSTFLNGPVAMVATFSSVIMGFFGWFVRDVATGTQQGGGPIESFIRIIRQMNEQVDIEGHPYIIGAMKGVDQVIMQLMRAGTYFLPDFRQFDTSRYVVYGYDIQPDLLAQHLTLGVAYFLVVTVVAYFFLKTREIAA